MKPTAGDTRRLARDLAGLTARWAIMLRGEPSVPRPFVYLSRRAIGLCDQAGRSERIRDVRPLMRSAVELASAAADAYGDVVDVQVGRVGQLVADATSRYHEWRLASTHEHTRPTAQYFAAVALADEADTLLCDVLTAQEARSAAEKARTASTSRLAVAAV